MTVPRRVQVQLQTSKFYTQYKLQKEHIDAEVSDEHIREIYIQLDDWRRVALHLGLIKRDIQAIENWARPNEQLMRLEMLMQWKRQNILDNAATYRQLIKALVECDCMESAIQVCQLITPQQS